MTSGPFERYSPTFFDALPSIEAANSGLASSGGLPKIFSALADVVHKYPAASRLGLQLLHRHADIDDDEVMLAHGNVTIPVKRARIAETSLANIVPTIWGLDPEDDTFVPLEFALIDGNPAHDDHAALDPDLAREVSHLLHSFDFERVLGLAILPAGDDHDLAVESTFERANILMPAQTYATLPPDAVEVVWQLGGQNRPKVECRQLCIPQRGGKHDWRGHYPMWVHAKQDEE